MTVTNITIYRGVVFEHYVYIKDSAGRPQDFTGCTFSALLKDKPGGTTLATFEVNTDTAPEANVSSAGWVQVRLDNSVTIPSQQYRGYWYLTISRTSGNPTIVEAGMADIAALA